MYNPIYFTLSFTFMTDVPFTTAVTVAILFLYTAIRTGKFTSFSFGWSATLFAVLCRQNGLAIPGGFACAQVLRYRTSLFGLLFNAELIKIVSP